MSFREPAAYFELHVPVRRQCRPRRLELSPLPGLVSGATLLHTSEGAMDTVGVDTGTDRLARFLLGNTRAASYHDAADSDSWLHLVDWDWEAFHDGTGSNPYTTSLSFVCRTVDWARMSDARRRGFLTQGALAFVAQQEWRRFRGYPLTRVRLISAAAVSAGESGFCYHGWRDPGRRTDPGTTAAAPFPRDEFFAIVRSLLPSWHPDADRPEPVPTIEGEGDMYRYRVIDEGHALHGRHYLVTGSGAVWIGGTTDGALQNVPIEDRSGEQMLAIIDAVQAPLRRQRELLRTAWQADLRDAVADIVAQLPTEPGE